MGNNEITYYLPGNRLARATVFNNTIYLSGIIADTDAIDFKSQMESVLSKIDQTLKDLGSHKDYLLQATIYLRDITQYEYLNLIWDNWITPGLAPARATIEAKMADPKYALEIMAIAAIPSHV
jgi:enamine deaminase RidA (YjgF/YER057c/UK114 family)